MDLSGRHQWHGPVEVARGKHQPQLKANSALITALGSGVAVGSTAQRAVRPAGLRVLPVRGPNRDVQAEIAAGQAAKIVVREDGWYHVTFQELTSAGFPVDASDTPTLRLYADGLEQAIEVTAGDDVQAPDGIEFYGSAVDTPYTDGRVYWLVKGERPGLRIQKTVVPLHVPRALADELPLHRGAP